jgi:hypothetical protein
MRNSPADVAGRQKLDQRPCTLQWPSTSPRSRWPHREYVPPQPKPTSWHAEGLAKRTRAVESAGGLGHLLAHRGRRYAVTAAEDRPT